MAVGRRSLDEVRSILEAHHGAPVEQLIAVRGGFWSAAYAYEVDGHRLIARFGADRSGYDADRAAMAIARPGLPVPEVLDVLPDGAGWLAISVRHHGTFLEELEPEAALRAAPSIGAMLAAIRSVKGPPEQGSWREWLRDGLVDDPARHVSGWRATMVADVGLLFDAAAAEVHRLLPSCPERRDLVHGDLLHQNVLVDDDTVTAVFSWKCSTFGDFLYDAAWCDFWAPWHPGIASLDVVGRTLAAPDVAPAELVGVAQRLRCYLLHIGAVHLAWCTWVGDDDAVRAVARRTAEVLEPNSG